MDIIFSILIARLMSPLIISFPDIKAMVGFSLPGERERETEREPQHEESGTMCITKERTIVAKTSEITNEKKANRVHQANRNVSHWTSLESYSIGTKCCKNGLLR